MSRKSPDARELANERRIAERDRKASRRHAREVKRYEFIAAETHYRRAS